MNSPPAGSPSTLLSRGSLVWLVGVLLLVLGFTFAASFQPGQALFANDGPLGAQMSEIYRMPGSFLGIWSDIYWLGAYGGNYAPNPTGFLLFLLGPLAFNKFLVPVALLLLGLSAGCFFRQLRFAAGACVVGGLAAALNSNFFSNACWGLSSRALSLAAAFLALAAIQSTFAVQSRLKVGLKFILAGLAIGLSVSEGGDNGAIFSLFVAAYAFYGSLIQQGPLAGRVLKGAGKVALMAVCAAILAAQTLSVFLTKDVKGTMVDDPAAMSKERRWSWATQWSLPSMESLRVLIPGLYGYRLDTPGGGDYWGDVGQEPGWKEGHKDPSWVQAHPNAFPRHSGAGEYAGVLVVLVGLWALAHSLVRQGGSFSLTERRMIWFWSAAALVALLLSWGRHAPFYQFIYALPYFSTIRNPMKFMHPFHMCLMILFAYGLQGIWRRYLEPAPGVVAKLKGSSAPMFEKRWWMGCAIALGLSVVGWLVYASSQGALARHLVDTLAYEPGPAASIAKFSSGEVGRSLFFLMASTGLLFLIGRGAFAGPRSAWAFVAMGILAVVDLGWANNPWIKYYDYKSKYASNGVLEVLANKPYEHRVALPPLQWDRNYAIFGQIYGVEWLQHQFPYYNIQSLDQPQDPRPPADKTAYRTALATNIVRLWELTNTRFLCGMAGNFADVLNQQLDPVQRRFKLHTKFNFTQDPNGNIGAHVQDNGVFGLIEFTGALPRAKLYTQWQVSTNDQTTLGRLASAAFNPHQEVLVAAPVSPPASPATDAPAGTVEFSSYAPKRVVLKANASAPSILLLNDKFDPQWNTMVDGQTVPILRCNFFMRGVQLPAGQHTVEFRYKPSSTIFLVSFSATLVGLALCVVLWIDARRHSGRAQ